MAELESNKYSIKSIITLHGDPILWTIFFILCVISILEVYSAGSSMGFEGRSLTTNILKHIAVVFFGFMLVLVTHRLKPYMFRAIYYLYPFVLIALILTPIIGTTENDSSRWLFGVQPSEFAKGILVVVTAHLLTNNQTERGTDRHAFWPIVIRTVLVCAIIFFENASTGIMLFGVIFLMMIIGRVPASQLIKLAASLLIIGGTFTGILLSIPKKDVQEISQKYHVMHRAANFRGRIARHFNLEKDSTEQTSSDAIDLNKETQVGHANIAIAKSNVIGRGPGNSTERDFLPAAYSDYIYAIIIEETGIIGATVVLMLYIFILFRAGRIASRCKKNFPAFVTLGLALLIVVQAMVNMAVAVGLFPVTGQPLPMISKGGTSMIVTSIYFGIMISVSHFADKRDDKTNSQQATTQITAQQ